MSSADRNGVGRKCESRRSAAAVEVESRVVNGHVEPTALAPPVESAPSQPEYLAEAKRGSDERYAPMREAEEILRRLGSTDPAFAISDPVERHELRKLANAILTRFGFSPTVEPSGER